MPPPVNYLDAKNRPKKSLGPNAKPRRDTDRAAPKNAEYDKKGKKKIHKGGQQKKE